MDTPCMYMTIGWQLTWIIIVGAFCYFYGLHDGLKSRPPVHKGDYDSGEHDDRVDDYPDHWE